MINNFNQNDIVLLTNFRSIFGNICIESLITHKIKFFTHVLSNNPYTLEKNVNRKFSLSLFKQKNKEMDLSLFYHDRTIDFLEATGSKYELVKTIDIEAFKKIIKLKPKLIILGDAPIINKECIQLTVDSGIPIVNLHAADLPEYRGNYSTYAMVKDKKKMCMTYHLVNEKIDSGAILDKYYLKRGLNSNDSYFTAERKLYIEGIEYFFKNIQTYIVEAKKLHKTTQSDISSPCVSITIENRYDIKKQFSLYLETVYNIKRPKVSHEDFLLSILSKNSKKTIKETDKKINLQDIKNQLSLSFEDNLSEEDKKFGLFHVDSHKIYKNFDLMDRLPSKIKYPNNKKWCVVLSHDVDMIPESKDLIKKIFEIEKKYNVSSTYLLAALKSLDERHENDPTYVLDENNTKELIYYIAANNHEIGLHGSFNSYNNMELLLEEKQRLENFVGMEIKSIRQHFLNFDFDQTSLIQSEVGFVIDSSLGFPSDVGIRTGYGAPIKFYNSNANKGIEILELPYLIMDQNILWNEKLENKPYKEKVQYLKSLLDVAKYYGIPVVLDWHVHTIELKEWWDIYDDILQYLSNDNSCSIMNMEQFYYAYNLLNGEEFI